MNIKSMFNKPKKIQLFFFYLLALCFLSSGVYCFATEFIPEVDGKDVENLLRNRGSLEGIAFESFVNGKFYETIGVLFINLDDKVIRKISFNWALFGDKIPGNVFFEELKIDEISKIGQNKISFTGRNSFGYHFLGEFSINEKSINFSLNIKGRGNIELKNIGSEGIKLKKKYLANLDLGLMNPGLE